MNEREQEKRVEWDCVYALTKHLFGLSFCVLGIDNGIIIILFPLHMKMCEGRCGSYQISSEHTKASNQETLVFFVTIYTYLPSFQGQIK